MTLIIQVMTVSLYSNCSVPDERLCLSLFGEDLISRLRLWWQPQWRQFGLKTGGVVGSGFKTGVKGPKSSTDKGMQHRIEGIIPSIFYWIIDKSFYFRKATTLESAFISYSCTLYIIIIFHKDPHDPIQKFWDRRPQTPQDWCLWAAE